ncbi:hypothetical protein [Streptacidiphilus sp. EB129]|uniref:hypothetical protein n=1 Tax=Streptacidiphilus sp. EB129 TaxID=3156262 RepID=UPI0035186990
MKDPQDPVTEEKPQPITPQERAERRANRIRIGSTAVELLRLGWEIFTHKW